MKRDMQGAKVPKMLQTPETQEFLKKYKTLLRVQQQVRMMTDVEKMKMQNLGRMHEKLQGYWKVLKEQMPKEFMQELDGMSFIPEEPKMKAGQGMEQMGGGE